jgi:hypothetical protein
MNRWIKINLNHISEEMGRTIDCIMEEKLKGICPCVLTLSHFSHIVLYDLTHRFSMFNGYALYDSIMFQSRCAEVPKSV